MRIVSGLLGGRVFEAPHGHATHPMSDKMRGALFNSLGDINDVTVLDAFAGSGALAFEALSRGAATAVLVEKDRSAQRSIQNNIKNLKLEKRAKLISAGLNSWLNTSDTTFDLIVLDPPYDKLQVSLLTQCSERLRPGGQLVLSWPGHLPPPVFTACELKRHKNYGDGSLYFFEASSR